MPGCKTFREVIVGMSLSFWKHQTEIITISNSEGYLYAQNTSKYFILSFTAIAWSGDHDHLYSADKESEGQAG